MASTLDVNRATAVAATPANSNKPAPDPVTSVPGQVPPPGGGGGPVVNDQPLPPPSTGTAPQPMLPPPPSFTMPPLPPAPPPADTGALQATATPAVTRTVNPETETVQGRLAGMLERPNAVQTQAQARALQAANARGLLNTSIATEAGTSALIQSALPIAQADANVYGTAARDNQTAEQQAAQATAAAQNQFASQRLQGALQIDAQRAQAENDMLKLVTQGNIEAGLQQMKALLQLEQARMDDQAKLLMQSNDTVKGLWGQTQTNITNIMLNGNLDAAAKDKAIRDQMNLLRASMALVGSLAGDVNLMGQLDTILGSYAGTGNLPGAYIPPPGPTTPGAGSGDIVPGTGG